MKSQGAYSLATTFLRQKRMRAFSIQYLSLFLLILTMVLPLYGERRGSEMGNDRLSLSTSVLRPELVETLQLTQLSSFPFEDIFLEQSSELNAERFEILKIFLQSHNLNIQLTVSGPIDSLPLLFARAKTLETSLNEAFSSTPQPPVAIRVDKRFLTTAEIYSGDEYDL